MKLYKHWLDQDSGDW